MGVVYAAYDPELDRKVAIKLLRTEAAGSEASEARMRLLREAQAMARLQHAQVIAVYDVGTIDGQVFIAMEFIDGGTLTGWLKEQPRTQAQILEVFTLAGRVWRLRTRLAWCTATSSPTTCWSAKMGRCASPTSAWRDAPTRAMSTRRSPTRRAQRSRRRC